MVNKLKTFAEYIKDIRKTVPPSSKAIISKKEKDNTPKRQRQDWKKEAKNY